MSDISEFQSNELLNPIPEKFNLGMSELEFLFVLVSTAPTESEILCVLSALESFEYQPVICDELHVGPSSVTLCPTGEIVATGHAEIPLD